MSHAKVSLTDLEGIPISKDAFVVVVCTEWNDRENTELVNGCIEVLEQNSIPYKIYKVPGAVEIPFAINSYWTRQAEINLQKPDSFIAFGCVIKGETPHFKYVCNMLTMGIAQLNITLPVPVIMGVLTVNNETQAWERLGGIHGHKGKEAAAAAIKMMALFEAE